MLVESPDGHTIVPHIVDERLTLSDLEKFIDGFRKAFPDGGTVLFGN